MSTVLFSALAPSSTYDLFIRAKISQSQPKAVDFSYTVIGAYSDAISITTKDDSIFFHARLSPTIIPFANHLIQSYLFTFQILEESLPTSDNNELGLMVLTKDSALHFGQIRKTIFLAPFLP